jgi:hypothetical protein
MKKSAVVVVKGSEVYLRSFEELDIINKGDDTRPLGRTHIEALGGDVQANPTTLIAREKQGDKWKVIAVFREWDYWRFLSEPDNPESKIKEPKSECKIDNEKFERNIFDLSDNDLITLNRLLLKISNNKWLPDGYTAYGLQYYTLRVQKCRLEKKN